MSDPTASSGKKTYGEKEISLILKQALELQHRQKAEAPVSQGLTLDELAAAGKEAGIDPAFIRQAALSLGTRPARLSGWAGGPLDVHLEAVLDRACGEDELKDLQMQLGSVFQGPGNGLVHRGKLAWDAQPNSYTSQYLPWRLLVEPAGGATRVSLDVDLKIWAWATHGVLLGLAGVFCVPVAVLAALGTGFPLAALGVLPLVLGGAYGLGWGLYRWTVRWTEKTGRRLLEKVVSRLGLP